MTNFLDYIGYLVFASCLEIWNLLISLYSRLWFEKDDWNHEIKMTNNIIKNSGPEERQRMNVFTPLQSIPSYVTLRSQ